LLSPLLLAVLLWFTDLGKELAQAQLVSRYDLRWEARADQTQRRQIIGLRNNGESEVNQVLVRVAVLKPHPKALADFSAGAFAEASQKSFVEELLRPEALRLIAGEYFGKVQTGVRRTLFDVEAACRKLHDDKTNGVKKRSERDARLESFVSRRSEWWQAAGKSWKELSGVEVTVKPALTTEDPLEQLEFVFALKPDEQKYLQLDCGPEAVDFSQPQVEFASKKPQTQVQPGDLRASFWSMWLWYDWPGKIVVLAILLPYLWLFWRRLKPLPSYDLFNYALRAERRQAWDEALHELERFIQGTFSALLTAQGKNPATEIGVEELKSYVKVRLIGDYAKRRGLRSQEELEQAIKRYLAEFANRL
jgi:hypothetical protein